MPSPVVVVRVDGVQVGPSIVCLEITHIGLQLVLVGDRRHSHRRQPPRRAVLFLRQRPRRRVVPLLRQRPPRGPAVGWQLGSQVLHTLLVMRRLMGE